MLIILGIIGLTYAASVRGQLQTARNSESRRDAYSAPLPDGAEDAWYQSLPEPYYPKNAPFTSLRELLRVRGWAEAFEITDPDPYAKFDRRPDTEAKKSELDPDEVRELMNSI